MGDWSDVGSGHHLWVQLSFRVGVWAHVCGWILFMGGVCGMWAASCLWWVGWSSVSSPVAVTIMHEPYQISQQASCMGRVNSQAGIFPYSVTYKPGGGWCVGQWAQWWCSLLVTMSGTVFRVQCALPNKEMAVFQMKNSNRMGENSEKKIGDGAHCWWWHWALFFQGPVRISKYGRCGYAK